ncbi:hypothetical protein [Sphaerisporangium sp. NPDC051011]
MTRSTAVVLAVPPILTTPPDWHICSGMDDAPLYGALALTPTARA